MRSKKSKGGIPLSPILQWFKDKRQEEFEAAEKASKKRGKRVTHNK